MVRGLVCILPRQLLKNMAERFGLKVLRAREELFIFLFRYYKKIIYEKNFK